MFQDFALRIKGLLAGDGMAASPRSERTAPAKVRLVALGNVPVTNDDQGARNQRFQEFVSRQTLFRGSAVNTIDYRKNRSKEALYNAVISLAQSGVRETSMGKFHGGQALDWSRLDFPGRQVEMCRVLRDLNTSSFGNSPNSPLIGDTLFEQRLRSA